MDLKLMKNLKVNNARELFNTAEKFVCYLVWLGYSKEAINRLLDIDPFKWKGYIINEAYINEEKIKQTINSLARKKGYKESERLSEYLENIRDIRSELENEVREVRYDYSDYNEEESEIIENVNEYTNIRKRKRKEALEKVVKELYETEEIMNKLIEKNKKIEEIKKPATFALLGTSTGLGAKLFTRERISQLLEYALPRGLTPYILRGNIDLGIWWLDENDEVALITTERGYLAGTPQYFEEVGHLYGLPRRSFI